MNDRKYFACLNFILQNVWLLIIGFTESNVTSAVEFVIIVIAD